MNLYQRLSLQPRNAHDVASGRFSNGIGIAHMLHRAASTRRFMQGSLNGFGFAAGVNGLGMLPEFTGGGVVVDAALKTKIDLANQTQITASALEGGADGAELLAVVQGLESSIAAAWDNWKAARALQAKMEAEPVNPVYTVMTPDWGKDAPGKPQVSNPLYNHEGGQAQFAAENANWLASNPAVPPYVEDFRYPGGLGQYAAALSAWQSYINGQVTTAKNQLGKLLDQYNENVPVAFKKVQDVIASRRHIEVAKNEAAATGQAIDTFVAQKKLDAAISASKAATAAVANPPSMITKYLPYVGGAVVVGGLIWYFTKGKK